MKSETMKSNTSAMRSFIVSIVLLLCLSSHAVAEVRLPRLFGDHMILQQETANAVWGWALPGEAITVNASWGASADAVADDAGKWMLFLDTPGHGVGHQLTISGENEIRIADVAIGEVWLCAGQSNMGWSVGNSFESEKEASVNLPNFRIFKSQREHWHEPLLESRDRLQQWKPCTQQSAFETSAVSYWFGKTLHQKLGVPVGIIVQAYAGTPIEGWMPWEIQQDDPRAIEHRAAIDRTAQRSAERGETVHKAIAFFEQEMNQYNRKIAAGETMKNSFRVLQPPIITKPASLGHQYPAHIFNAMIHPIRPYGIRGMIWYQGERNSKNVPQAAHYQEQLPKLIEYYRSSWNSLSNGNVSAHFPFQCTQLPSWNPAQVQPVEGLEAPWAVSRESMRLVSSKIQNVGLVTTIDTGDAIELHPKNKKPIGLRHALLALNKTYGKEIVGQGPEYAGHHLPGNGTVVIEFSSRGSGLRATRQSEPLSAFAVAGQNKEWFWANAVLDGESVVVSSEHVAKPVAVRYAWAMNPSQQNLLYNQEGLPASPFRTDSWPLWEPGDSVPEVNKPKKPNGYQPLDWDRPDMPQASIE